MKEAQMKRIRRIIRKHNIVAVVLPKSCRNHCLTELLRLTTSVGKVCYIANYKKCNSFQKVLEKPGVIKKHIFVINCSGSQLSNDYAGFVQYFPVEPSDLKTVNVALNESLILEADSVIVDELSSFTEYQSSLLVKRFARDIISKIRNLDRKGVVLVFDNKRNASLIADLHSHVDKVVQVMEK